MTDRIDEIKALRSAAQVIAWKTRPVARDGNHYILELGCDESPIATVRGDANARLIAAAPELLAWCVAEIERLRERVTDYECAAARYRITPPHGGLVGVDGQAIRTMHSGDNEP